MRSEAYKITGFTAVAAALGFLLRWLQDMKILDPDTGLAVPGAGVSVLVALYILAVGVALAYMSRRMSRFDAPLDPAGALGGETFLTTGVCLIPAALLFVAGFALLMTADAAHFPAGQVTLRKVCAAATLLGAAGTALLAVHISAPERAGLLRTAILLVLIFGGMWLVTEYKAAASDPVIWRYAVEILAVCAALLAFYYVAGYFYGVPAPRASVFTCYFGGFLCVVSAVDEHSLAETIQFIAAAALLFIWGFLLVNNMKPAGTLTGPEK